jgi:hypothetical protein
MQKYKADAVRHRVRAAQLSVLPLNFGYRGSPERQPAVAADFVALAQQLEMIQ